MLPSQQQHFARTTAALTFCAMSLATFPHLQARDNSSWIFTQPEHALQCACWSREPLSPLSVRLVTNEHDHATQQPSGTPGAAGTRWEIQAGWQASMQAKLHAAAACGSRRVLGPYRLLARLANAPLLGPRCSPLRST